jgi:4-aminobutyrate aminotransferase-like enzyme
MFAIEYYGVEPDMIITAKGIADGFPLSAFTTRPEIAAAYQPGDHFSTFGGNPVSCAAALANINVIEREDLCQRSAENGTYTLSRFKELQASNPLIGEVRGMGLMIGIELVKDEKLTPAAAEAEAIRETMLSHGILVGVGGSYGNVVRFQPPLVISREQIDAALAVFAQALEDVARSMPRLAAV